MASLIGNIQWQSTTEKLLLSLQRDRGPEIEGSWLSGDRRCWLAHTRPANNNYNEASAHPITSRCGRYTLVFNGLITNSRQVRQMLRFQGWRSNSDCETLVEGLAQRGPAFVLELRGMFVFAAYDNDKEQLLLGRDRLGIKPLYLSWHPGGLQFGSQRRALMGSDQLEAQTISQVLAFGHDCSPANFPGPDATGIASFPAGMLVRINHSRPHDPVRYWPPQPRPDWTPLPIRDTRWCRTFLRQQLEEAVAQHLIGDVPVVCLLSTSLDSGILAALACRLKPNGISTFTVTLQGDSEVGASQARRMARYCGSKHHELLIQEDVALSWVKQGLAALDTPTASGLTTYLISHALVREGIKVALSGVGADELFGGTHSHRLIPWLRVLRWLPARLRHRLLESLRPRLAPKLAALPHWDSWHLLQALSRWANDCDLQDALAIPLQSQESIPVRITQAWGQISWAELFVTTEPMLLRNADAMSMACGLDLRMPFLDHRLVEIALRIPQRFQQPGKSLLRKSCADLLPSGYLDHPSPPFTLPMAIWMQGPLRELCCSRLKALEQSGWLDPGWIRQHWQAFEAGHLIWQRAWSLVVLGEFASRDVP
jgi:asparagine synthase (glutamine-hydrolysing)